MSPLAEVTSETSAVGPLAWTAALSSVGSLAHALQAKRRLTGWQIVGAAVNSAVNGVIAYCLLTWKFKEVASDSPLFLIGLSAAAGLGQASMLDMILTAFRAKTKETP